MNRYSAVPSASSLVVRTFAILAIAGCSLWAEVLIPANDANINYYGRFSFNTPTAPAFQWEGSTIEASFPGPSIGFSMDEGDGSSLYEIEIDGVHESMITATKGSAVHYTVRTNLSTATHTIRIILRNETHWDIKAFTGFYLADGKALVPKAKPVRKIEFIGDSWTAGYGVESTSRSDCGTLNATTNVTLAFPTFVTKSFRAQDIVLGYSGAGLVHNFTDAVGMSAKPMPFYYDSIFADAFWHSGPGLWNFSSWIPDLVVIFLGINDFSSGFPGDNAYITGYHNLITRVLGHYPNATILCVQSHNTVGSSGSDADINTVVAAETTTLNHKKVYTVGNPTNLAVTSCNWHPTAADQKSLASTYISKIMKIMAWDTTSSSAIENVARSGMTRRATEVRILSADSRGVTAHINSAVFPTTVAVLDVSGKCVAIRSVGQNQLFRWNAAHIPMGMFLIGNSDIGWTKFAVKSR